MLSLLDILFPDATMNLVKKLSPMKTIQPSINLWDKQEKYNGWSDWTCLLYTSPSPRDAESSRMPSSA